MTDLLSALERLDELWVSLGHPPERRLLPGLAPEVARTQLSELEPNPPEDLVTWFSWHNGSPKVQPQVLLAPAGYAPRSLVQCIQARDASLAMAEGLFDPDVQTELHYRPSWLPIADGPCSDLCVAMADGDPGPAGTVYVLAWDDYYEPPVPAAQSLTEVVDMWVSILETGAITWSQTGWQRPIGALPLPLRLRGLLP